MLLVLTTWPDRALATEFAHAVLETRLAACVHIGTPVQVLYRWQGKVEQGQEFPLQLKTSPVCYPKLEAAIQAAHPYDVPEIIALSVNAGLPAYMDWVITETKPIQPDRGNEA